MFREFSGIHGILTEKILFFFRKSNYQRVIPKLISNGFMIDMPGFRANGPTMTIGLEKRKDMEKKAVPVPQWILEKQSLRNERGCLKGRSGLEYPIV